jgi:hypothetical protein
MTGWQSASHARCAAVSLAGIPFPSCTATINVRRISPETPRFAPCRPHLVVFGGVMPNAHQRAFAGSAQIVFQTIERSLDGGHSHFDGGATTNSGVSVTLALIEFAMKQWASTPSMLLRAGSSSASLLRVTRGRTVTLVMLYFPSTFSSRPSASLSYPTGVRTLGLSKREECQHHARIERADEQLFGGPDVRLAFELRRAADDDVGSSRCRKHPAPPGTPGGFGLVVKRFVGSLCWFQGKPPRPRALALPFTLTLKCARRTATRSARFRPLRPAPAACADFFRNPDQASGRLWPRQAQAVAAGANGRATADRGAGGGASGFGLAARAGLALDKPARPRRRKAK